MQPVLFIASRIWRHLGQECVVTSARDGKHSWGSLHYYGYAVDLRTRYFEDKGAAAHEKLRDTLHKISSNYDVVLHKTHIHVEFDAFRAGVVPGLERKWVAS